MPDSITRYYDKGVLVKLSTPWGDVERVTSPRRKSSRGLTLGGTKWVTSYGEYAYSSRTPSAALKWLKAMARRGRWNPNRRMRFNETTPKQAVPPIRVVPYGRGGAGYTGHIVGWLVEDATNRIVIPYHGGKFAGQFATKEAAEEFKREVMAETKYEDPYGPMSNIGLNWIPAKAVRVNPDGSVSIKIKRER